VKQSFIIAVLSVIMKEYIAINCRCLNQPQSKTRQQIFWLMARKWLLLNSPPYCKLFDHFINCYRRKNTPL